MHRRTFIGALAGGVAGLTGCRSLARSHRTPPSSGYRRRVGLATWVDINDKAGEVMMRHQYVPRRVEQPPAIYIESEWRQREPFDDERAHGAEQARSRLVLTGRVSPTKVSALGEVYELELLIENQARRLDGDWGDGGMTPQFLEYANRIADDLESSLRSTVRRF